MFDEIYILFHFNIILMTSSTKEKEKPKATKWSDHRTLNLEEQKETESDITGILDMGEEFCVCFIDWQINLE